jgi:hypothetical protein
MDEVKTEKSGCTIDNLISMKANLGDMSSPLNFIRIAGVDYVRLDYLKNNAIVLDIDPSQISDSLRGVFKK